MHSSYYQIWWYFGKSSSCLSFPLYFVHFSRRRSWRNQMHDRKVESLPSKALGLSILNMVGWAAQNNEENHRSVESIRNKSTCNSCRVCITTTVLSIHKTVTLTELLILIPTRLFSFFRYRLVLDSILASINNLDTVFIQLIVFNS